MDAAKLTPERREELRRDRLIMVPYDFAPQTGTCWTCKTDLIAHYGDRWPRAIVTGCPKCCRSYCD